MKNFILSLWFVRKLIEEEKQKYQFENLGVIKQANARYFKEIDEVVEEKLKELLGNVDYRAVVTNDKQGNIFVGGVKQEESQLMNLRSEAEFFLASDLYRILSETKKDLAYKTMFEKSENFEDLRTGKLVLYNISIDRNIIERLRNWQPTQGIHKK